MLGVIPAAEDGAAAELPLERLTALAPRLRQIQQAGLELFSHVLDIDLPGTSIQARMRAYTDRHSAGKTPCYEFRKLTTRYEQLGGVYLERLYPQDIYDLIDYSLQRCLQKELRFRVCKNCGRYFAISRSAKAEYCDTFPDENGRTCRNVGAITAWTKKRENDDVFQTIAENTRSVLPGYDPALCCPKNSTAGANRPGRRRTSWRPEKSTPTPSSPGWPTRNRFALSLQKHQRRSPEAMGPRRQRFSLIMRCNF